MKNRKEARKDVSPFRLHTKKFTNEKSKLEEQILEDGSIKFQVEGFASTEIKDGSGDVVKAEGIDTTRFEQNPILKRGHKRGEENNIGVVTKIDKVQNEGLYIKADIILNSKIEEHIPVIHGLRHGLINGFSIGFGKVEQAYDETTKANVISSLELYEISLVDIPDNPMTVRKFVDTVKSMPMDDEEETPEFNQCKCSEYKGTGARCEKCGGKKPGKKDLEETVEETTEDKTEEIVAETTEEAVTETKDNEEKVEEITEEATAEEVEVPEATTEEVKEETEEVEVPTAETPATIEENPEAIEVGADKKSLSLNDTIENQLKTAIMKELGISDQENGEIGGNEYVYVVGIFPTEFIYCHCSYKTDNSFEKYYRRGYVSSNGLVGLVGESIEVARTTEWEDKKEAMKKLETKEVDETNDSQESEGAETATAEVEETTAEVPAEIPAENAEVVAETTEDKGVKCKHIHVEVKDSEEYKDLESKYLQLETDSKEVESMLAKMLTANEKLLLTLAEKDKIIARAKKIKLANGLPLEKNVNNSGRIGNIVDVMRNS